MSNIRKPIPPKIQLQIWNRDNWTCQYCGQPVFFAPTLKLLDKLSPGHGYYHPNGKTDKMLALFQWRWASVDHVVPFSKGGENNIENYVTACWECNLKINDKTEKQGKPKKCKMNTNTKNVNWDGLSSLYPKLSDKEDIWTGLLSI